MGVLYFTNSTHKPTVSVFLQISCLPIEKSKYCWEPLFSAPLNCQFSANPCFKVGNPAGNSPNAYYGRPINSKAYIQHNGIVK